MVMVTDVLISLGNTLYVRGPRQSKAHCPTVLFIRGILCICEAVTDRSV